MSLAMPVVHRIQPLHSQQLALSFDNSSARKLFVMRTGKDAQARRDAEVQDMFLSAVQFEESPATIPQAMKIYQAILAMQPEHAPALINLGTVALALVRVAITAMPKPLISALAAIIGERAHLGEHSERNTGTSCSSGSVKQKLLALPSLSSSPVWPT